MTNQVECFFSILARRLPRHGDSAFQGARGPRRNGRAPARLRVAFDAERGRPG